MAVYQAQVSIPYYTNVPSDVSTNTLYFEWAGGGSPVPGNIDDIAFHLKTFFEDLYGGIGSNVATMAKYAVPANTHIKVYNLSDAKPRVPKLDEPMPLSGVNQDATTSSLPPESACVMSYRGNYVSGVNRQSQRGRIYIGVLGDGYLTKGTGSTFPTLSDSARTEVCSAASLMHSNMAGSDWKWVVHSEKLLDDFEVHAGWVDAEFDTQRRRGVPSNNRKTFSF